ncbi:hypothetical protein FocnCong_v001892 [Fusarium oxysporum f. sp. conglutinans]|nr:hypothetical protein FocnCong_v001892 [Fusarium oxysporum f. sp. conglutinans]
MPLKSHELFHYFYQPGGSAGASPADHRQRRMAYIISDPEALRSAVLIAATHFGFKFGNLKNFEQTFYFHTLETVRLVCRGDHQMAEKHLNAIYALSRHREGRVTTGGKTMDQELSDRYFLITSTFMHGITTALDGTRRLQASLRPRPVQYLRTRRTQSYSRVPRDLQLQRRNLQDIPLAGCSQDFEFSRETSTMGIQKPLPRSARQIQDDFWQSETSAMLYDGLIEAHKSSVPKNHKSQANTGDENEQKASWAGLLIAIELYLEQVVVLWRPFTRENYLYTMRIFQRDLGYALHKPDAPQLADLLFWESFVAVISLQMHEKQGDLAKEPGIRPYFEGFAREQSRVLGLKTWKDAKAALLRIAWPCDFTDDDYVKGIWEAVMEYEAVVN